MLTSQTAEPDYSVEETVDMLPDDLFGMMDDVVPEPKEKPKDEPVAEADEEEDQEDDEAEDEEEGDEGDPEEDSEGDDSEEGGEEADEEEGDSDDAGDDPADKLFEVQIGDDTYEVNLEELKHGYLRSEDYLRKVTEFETLKEEAEQELASERAVALSEIETIRKDFAIKSTGFENVNWEQLKATDPQEYVVKRAQYAELIEERGKLETQRTALTKLEQKHQEIQQRAYLQKQSELVQQLIPEWKDDTKRPALQKSIAEYALQQGLSQEEVSTLSDARLLTLLNKARLYDDGLKKRQAVAKKKVPKEVQTAIKPGSGSDRSAPSGKRVKEAAARFKNNGSLHNTVDYLDAIGFELPTLK